MEIKYLLKKIKSSWASNTFNEKFIRYLVNQIKRYIFLPFLNLIRPTHKFKLNLIDGYKDHRLNKDFLEIKPDQIIRIVKAYKLAKLEQKKASSEYEINGLWNEWISINFKELIINLKNENFEALSKLFNNIIREQCTRGLGGYDEWYRYNCLFGKSYIKYVWIDYYKKLIDLQGDKSIIFPKVGNPCGIIHKNKIIPIESLRHAYRAEEIKNCLNDMDEKVIVEIGGGYGGLGFQLVSKLEKNQNTKFILFDIPEVVAISSAFLLSSFPDKKIRLYGEGSISSTNKDFEIGIFPHFTIDNLEYNSIDLFYNSCSFSEMDEVTSRKYLSVIEKCCRKYFMHDNHEIDFNFLKIDGTYSKNIIGSKLIPNSNNFKLIYKKPRTHGLPEDSSFKSFEYLYEKFKGNS
jgi:hypothetical protein